MAKEFFKAVYKNGRIRTEHNMSYKHLLDLHKDLTKLLKEAEPTRETCTAREIVPVRPRIVKKAAVDEAPRGQFKEVILFGVVGSCEAAEGLF